MASARPLPFTTVRALAAVLLLPGSPWMIPQSESTRRSKRIPGKTKQNPLERTTAPIKILVVEDHPDSREVLVLQLLRMSFKEIIEAERGEEGIEKALAEGPDIIIMDLGLPGMNGIETTARLKQNPQTAHIPVIALTAWGEQFHKEKALEAGMVEYLTKPARLQAIKDVIEKVLQTRA